MERLPLFEVCSRLFPGAAVSIVTCPLFSPQGTLKRWELYLNIVGKANFCSTADFASSQSQEECSPFQDLFPKCAAGSQEWGGAGVRNLAWGLDRMFSLFIIS